MNSVEQAQILLKPGIELTVIESGIYSTVTNPRAQSFDRLAGVYDRLIRSKLYNGLVWGTSPTSYRCFAEQAHKGNPQFMLDAGCGSMAVTAEAHAKGEGLVVGLDSSLPMLRLAKARLGQQNARNVVLILGSVEDIPFRQNAFESILFMGMAHLFPDDSTVMDELMRVLMSRGQIHLSSLVENRRKFGDKFLAKLKAKGEVNAIRSPKAVLQSIESVCKLIDSRTEGNMLFASAVR